MFELGCTYSSEELSLNKMLGQLQDAEEFLRWDIGNLLE